MRLSYFILCAALAAAPGAAEARGGHGHHSGGHHSGRHHAASHHSAAHHSHSGHSRHVHSVTRSFVHSIATGAGGQIGRDAVRGAERPSTSSSPASAPNAPKYQRAKSPAGAAAAACPTTPQACRDFIAAAPQSQCAAACAAIVGQPPR